MAGVKDDFPPTPNDAGFRVNYGSSAGVFGFVWQSRLTCVHRENFLVLDIFFEALNYETIEQKKAYDVAGLLGMIYVTAPSLFCPNLNHAASSLNGSLADARFQIADGR